MEGLLEPTPDPAWLLAVGGYDPLREPIYEARFAISNGLLGVRGGRAVSRGARWIEPVRTYVAGLFDIPGPEHAVPELIAAPSWLQTRIVCTGGPLVLHPAEVSRHDTVLDMWRGALLTRGRITNDRGLVVQVRTLRLVSLQRRAIGLHVVELETERGDAEIALEASFEGMGGGLVPERIGQDLGVWRTRYSGKRLAAAAALSLQVDGSELAPARPGPFTWSWRWKTCAGQVVSISRLVSMARGDTPDDDPGRVAAEKLRAARQLGWRRVVREHEAAWRARWQASDLQVEGDPDAQRALRFAAYHLIGAANPEDEHVSIGARGLTGDEYHGHVFWDTEIYLLPFYTLTWPEAARTLLMYRFRTIGGARAKAAAQGWRGAMYAWESADTGAEVTPDQVVGPDGRIIDVLCGKQEQHITADVAYAVWHYWHATADEEFLLNAGAEILLETARFWSSRAQPETDGLCHIRGVIGPDEYHEHVDDNAFTNVMARWNIRRALEAAALLRERWPDQWAALSSRLELNDPELAHWRMVADRLATGWDPETGLFEQFAGYFGLEDIDLAAYAGRTAPMDVILGKERTQRSKVIKQADVVALLGLLPDEFPGDSAAKNFRYYEPRCSHGSSLSAPMHALVAARLGDAEQALQYFRRAVAVDLTDTRTTIAGGVHMAALGGAWMAAVLGFAGLSVQDDGVSFQPRLPASWRGLSFGLAWRGRRLGIRIDASASVLRAALEAGEAMPVRVNGRAQVVRPDQAAVFSLDRGD